MSALNGITQLQNGARVGVGNKFDLCVIGRRAFESERGGIEPREPHTVVVGVGSISFDCSSSIDPS